MTLPKALVAREVQARGRVRMVCSEEDKVLSMTDFRDHFRLAARALALAPSLPKSLYRTFFVSRKVANRGKVTRTLRLD